MNKIYNTKKLVFSATAIALSLVCSLIKFANLPMGGSITLFSMLFVTLIGYWYGTYTGLITSVAYGILQFVIEPVFYTPLQIALDYVFAFGSLGLSGLFCNKKHGLTLGYTFGVLFRYLFSVISGFVFFGEYAPEGTPAIIYSLTYNATYIVPEAIITIILISLPPVKSALNQIKNYALA